MSECILQCDFNVMVYIMYVVLKLFHNISGTIGISKTLSPELEIAVLKQNVSITSN
jgi:hypothetical protein